SRSPFTRARRCRRTPGIRRPGADPIAATHRPRPEATSPGGSGRANPEFSMTTISPPTRKNFPTHPDLTRASRTQVATLLNRRLADAIDLQTQCKQAHWNVKGPTFIALHRLF